MARRHPRALKNLEWILAIDHGVEGVGRVEEHDNTDFYVEIVGEVIYEDENVVRVRPSATWWMGPEGPVIDQQTIERIVKKAIIRRKKLR